MGKATGIGILIKPVDDRLARRIINQLNDFAGLVGMVALGFDVIPTVGGMHSKSRSSASASVTLDPNGGFFKLRLEVVVVFIIYSLK